MRHAILLIYDHPEKKTVEVPRRNLLVRLLCEILSIPIMEKKSVDCFCIKNNSIDRAKMLIRYLRKQLKLRRDQITFLRTSAFETGEEARYALEYLFKRHRTDDVLFYYTGHGINVSEPGSARIGWSLGKEKYLHYLSLRDIFKKFQGRLIFINDCCHALAIDQHLKLISGRYLLFGASRRGCIASKSILDPVLGYWFHKKPADPRVAYVGRLDGVIVDMPAYATRGDYYYCGCGSNFEMLKSFIPSNAPSLRRGAELDAIWFPA